MSRCEGKTYTSYYANRRCFREARPGALYCHQHGPESRAALPATTPHGDIVNILPPLYVMANAPWNILDASGCRVAACFRNDSLAVHELADELLAAEIVRRFNAALPATPAPDLAKAAHDVWRHSHPTDDGGMDVPRWTIHALGIALGYVATPAPKPDGKCPGCGRDADFVETFHGAKSCYHPFHDAKPDATGVDRVEILPLVTADLAARIAKGAQQYGEPLTSHNGRDALQDAYEEALDLSCYLKQAIVERAARDGSK